MKSMLIPFLLVLCALPLVVVGQKSKDHKRFERNADYGTLWKQANYTITVETDTLYLQKGQYLYLASRMGDTKIDLPESWAVQQAFVTDASFVVEFEHQKFECSRYFMSQLDNAILQLGPQFGLPKEEELQALWDNYNGKF